MNGNDPRVLVELRPYEASWLMDILHEEWSRRVGQSAIAGFRPRYDNHIFDWYKWRASMLLNRVDANADQQGFGNL